MAASLLTYYDAVTWCMDFLGSSGAGSMSQRDIRRAIQAALRDLGAQCDWSFLYKHGRVQLHAQQTFTGVYDHSGGTYERQLTFSTSTAPSWAADAVVRFASGNYVCHVESRKSASVVTLDATLNPGTDVASGSCTIWPSYYLLPADFESLVEIWGDTSWRRGESADGDTLLALDRYETATGDLDYYCVRAVDDMLGTMGLFISPPSEAAETVDFLYKRRARDLRYTGLDAADSQGTVSASAGSTAVTGTGTAFSSLMVGSVIRFGTDGTNVPTGLDGLYPYQEEAVVGAVTDATHLTLTGALSLAVIAKKYCITDPIDIHTAAYNALLWGAAHQLSGMREMKVSGEVAARYSEAVSRARAADNRVHGRKVAGQPMRAVYRMADNALGDDVT